MRWLFLTICLAVGFGAVAFIMSTRPDLTRVAKAVRDPATPVDIAEFDAKRGKLLFVTKGCVVCHSVNGVGGSAAPALDAPISDLNADPMIFAARMWRGAPAMISLQRMELGYNVDFSGEELAALAAFGTDKEVQSGFSITDVPEPMQDWFLEELAMDDEGWVQFLKEEWPAYSTEPPESEYESEDDEASQE